MVNFTLELKKDKILDFSDRPQLHVSKEKLFFLRMFARTYVPAGY